MSLKHPQEHSVSYPLVHLKPAMSVFSLKLPLCELNTEKAESEVGGREGRRKAEGGRRREGERKREGDRSVGVRSERRKEGTD